MKILGRHLVVEYSDCDKRRLDDLRYLEDAMKEAVRRSGATIVRSVFHRYNPQGVSGVIVIAESHISIHTWPEYGYAAVDFFTCGESVDPHLAHKYMLEALHAGRSHVQELKRGIPSETDEVIRHKPFPQSVNRAAAAQ
jgi:S-adenosylmethionine decarboxylase